MRVGITTKLFVTLVAISTAIIVAMAISARISFSRGFLGYLNEQGLHHIQSLEPRFASAYREHGNWEFLRGQGRRWYVLVRATPPQASAPPPSPSELDVTGLPLRVTLLDAGKRFVMGNPGFALNGPMHPIRVGGDIVGWLTLVPFQQVTAVADVRFQQRQFTAHRIIAASAIVLAALAAWGLSLLLVTPLRRITLATNRLARGDYAVRIPVGSKDEIGRLSEDFNRLAQTLFSNEQLRRSFMADVSHELRTPLAILKGELEAIEDGVRPATPATMASLRSEVDTLGKLVSDLYDLSLADVGALSYRMVDLDLGEVLGTAIAAFEQRFAQRGLKLDVNIATNPIVCGDEGRLHQLFNNLFENSARYTDSDGTLRISLRQADDAIYIEIEDSGPGVSEDLLPHLFERFVRTDNSRRRANGGAGLGLAISRAIVEAHGGSIHASAGPLGGLLICVRLPRAPAITGLS